MNDQRTVIHYLIRLRRRARSALRELDMVASINRQARRKARQYRESGNPMLARTASNIEANCTMRHMVTRLYREELIKIGRDIMTFADYINAAVPTWALCDVLGVNRADRAEISITDGIVEIAYIHGLEDSAMYRGEDWKQGPLAQSVMCYISHELATNNALQERANEHLFGKGGMFEFLPTYRRRPDGEFVKNPPKLRLADDCDLKGAA